MLSHAVDAAGTAVTALAAHQPASNRTTLVAGLASGQLLLLSVDQQVARCELDAVVMGDYTLLAFCAKGLRPAVLGRRDGIEYAAVTGISTAAVLGGVFCCLSLCILT